MLVSTCTLTIIITNTLVFSLDCRSVLCPRVCGSVLVYLQSIPFLISLISVHKSGCGGDNSYALFIVLQKAVWLTRAQQQQLQHKPFPGTAAHAWCGTSTQQQLRESWATKSPSPSPRHQPPVEVVVQVVVLAQALLVQVRAQQRRQRPTMARLVAAAARTRLTLTASSTHSKTESLQSMTLSL